MKRLLPLRFRDVAEVLLHIPDAMFQKLWWHACQQQIREIARAGVNPTIEGHGQGAAKERLPVAAARAASLKGMGKGYPQEFFSQARSPFQPTPMGW
ncbi:MAG: hypothetical protein JST38_05740 [Bacteroidetes bacterium]|nr:hypothetical protein [Bacteroidota bacterium]MBS1940361.1 hypothetical protein [Bacteroidota bacterium]